MGLTVRRMNGANGCPFWQRQRRVIAQTRWSSNRFQAMDGVNGTPLFKISAHHFWHWNTPSIIIKFCKSFGWLSTLTGRAVTVNPYYLEPVGGPNQGSISSVVPHRERVWHTCHTCRPITSLWRSYKGSIYMLLQKGTTPFLSLQQASFELASGCSPDVSRAQAVVRDDTVNRNSLSLISKTHPIYLVPIIPGLLCRVQKTYPYLSTAIYLQ